MSTTITNCWGSARTIRLAPEEFTVHKADSWTAAYSHHPQITSRDGRLYATWSLGHLHEDCPGQKMVCSTSDDKGESWSPPVTVVAPSQGECAETCVTSLGIRAVGRKLIAYYAHYDLTTMGLAKFAEFGAHSRGIPGLRCLQDVHAGVVVSEDGGRSWRGPAATIPGIVPNLSPVRLASGRLVFPCHQMFPYSDDPEGITGWKMAALPDLPEGFYEGAGGEIPNTAPWSSLGVCEGCVYEKPYGVVRMMLRTGQGVLAVSESRDNGESWSAPVKTSYTDCGCRFQFGRLPDGRYFGLSCPNPNIPESCLRRTPLVLALSEDGDVFDRHFILGDAPDLPLRFPGAYKHGRYGYPYSHVLNDTVFVIHSVGKEDVVILRFKLADLT